VIFHGSSEELAADEDQVHQSCKTTEFTEAPVTW
jgi:hypothetical protein